MSYVHHEPFKARHYECDPYGNLHYATYLGYMQEAAFAGSAAVGYSDVRYAQLNYQWLAYETGIEYFAPLRYGNAFTVKTWVHDFRRVRSLRKYEFYRGGQLMARASTDWVLLDLETLRPITVPPEMVEAYAAGDSVAAVPRQDPLPKSRQPETGLFTLRRRVKWRDLDPVAHVNNATYIHFADDCGMQARQALGWPVARIEAMGCRVNVGRHLIEYKTPAQLEDELELSSWLSDVTETTALRHTTISRAADGKLLNRVRTLLSWVDLETGEDRPIPQAFRDDLVGNTI
jgi:acyl-CoA thioester hydrolase